MGQRPAVQSTFNDVPANNVGQLINTQIRNSGAVSAQATRTPAGTWTVVITRPGVGAAGAAGGNG